MAKLEFGPFNLSPLLADMMLTSSSRGSQRDIAGGKGFPSRFHTGFPGASSFSSAGSQQHPTHSRHLPRAPTSGGSRHFLWAAFSSTLENWFLVSSRGWISSRFHRSSTTQNPLPFSESRPSVFQWDDCQDCQGQLGTVLCFELSILDLRVSGCSFYLLFLYSLAFSLFLSS